MFLHNIFVVFLYMNLKYLKNTENLEFFYTRGYTFFFSLVFFLIAVQAGFPSPADDYMESDLDLNDYLVQNPSATFCVKAIEKDKLIEDSKLDIKVVDKSLEPNRSIVFIIIDGEFTVKRVNINSNKLYLVPENNDFSPIEITEEMDFKVWGVVTYVIHKAV